jgi:hypothetical protein
MPGLMRVRERFGRPFPVVVGQLWARSWLVSGVWDRMLGSALRGAAVGELESCAPHFRRSRRSNLIWVEAPGLAVSRWVQLWHRRMTDGFPGSAPVLVGQRGASGWG